MGTSDSPRDPHQPSFPDPSDRTVTAGGPGGAAAGQIGPYRLLQMLGEGGMGEVWLAEQRTPIHRTFAMKLIKAGMDTKAVVARFESERQALALMDHPSIARVYSAGSTAEGRPYFVMEYVPGLPITEYCDKHRLTLKERLELFLQVCDGVQHAHQKAIIHRDLKPSNILVVGKDNKAVPKIIDFGLAKATAQRLTEKTMFTEVGVMMGTPEYMSPEQADQQEQNLDTRTDVYSLGVILYQLLVGVVPFEAKAMRGAGLEAILRMIREEEPPKPSTKIRSMGELSNATAEKRKEEPRSFARHVQGELDWITMKALEKDRARRYGSPAEIGGDIQHYLRNEPVTAHPPSAGYRASKYIRRHRLGVAMAATAVVLLAAFAIAQAFQLRRITRERNRADRIAGFMTDMFEVSDPSETRGNTVTAREILDKAATQIETGLRNDPELQGKMMYTMGDTYFKLGLYSRAKPLLERAVEIQRGELGPRSPETLNSMARLSAVLKGEGHYAEAEKQLRETLETQRRVLGPKNKATLTSMSNLAGILTSEGRYAEAEKLYRETIAIQRRVIGPEDPETLRAQASLASVLMLEGHSGEAAILIRETFDTRRRVLGPENQGTLASMAQLSGALQTEGRIDESEQLDRQSLDIQRRILGPEHPDTLNAMSDLANTLMVERKYVEAEKLQRETVDLRRRVLGPDHPDTLLSMGNLANLLMQEGRYAEAEKLSRETYAIDRRVYGPEHPYSLGTLENEALAMGREGRYAEAEKLFRESIQTASRADEPGVVGRAWYSFACMAASEGRREEALEYLGQAIKHGYSEPTAMRNESDLKSLQGDPRFEALVMKAAQLAAAEQK